MHRIDGANHAGNMFKETPAPGTKMTAAWANAVQEELVKVITDPAGGNAGLAKGNNGQLLAAILAIVARGGGDRLLDANGYYTLPGGVIIQWGAGSEGVNDFPVEFPTACWRVIWSLNNVTDDGDESDEPIWRSSKSTTGFTLSGAGDRNTAQVDWIAIGN